MTRARVRAARPAADEPVQRHPPPDRLHRLDRGARGRHHRHLGRRPRPHHRGRDQPRDRRATTSSPPATSSRWWRARAARWSAPAIPRPRSISRAWPGSTRPGVICEIMNDDGTMARLPDLVAFAQRHNLKLGTIADLIAYRRRTERLVRRVMEAPFHQDSIGGDWKLYRLRQHGRICRAHGAGEGRPVRPGAGAGAHACGGCRRRPAARAVLVGVPRRHADDRRGRPRRRGGAARDQPTAVSDRVRRRLAGAENQHASCATTASARRSCSISACATWCCCPTRRAPSSASRATA